MCNRIASSAHGYVRRPALEHEQNRTIESCATNVCSLVVVFDRRAHKLHWLYRVPLTLELTAVQQWHAGSYLDPLQWDNCRCRTRRNGFVLQYKTILFNTRRLRGRLRRLSLWLRDDQMNACWCLFASDGANLDFDAKRLDGRRLRPVWGASVCRPQKNCIFRDAGKWKGRAARS